MQVIENVLIKNIRYLRVNYYTDVMSTDPATRFISQSLTVELRQE